MSDKFLIIFIKKVFILKNIYAIIINNALNDAARGAIPPGKLDVESVENINDSRFF